MTKSAFLTVPAACLAWILAGPSPALSSEWPQFRGPGGLGIGAAKGLPATWSDQENLVWKAPLPGAGASSPIALGDRLYLTSYTGYGRDVESPGEMKDLKLHLICVGAKDGKIVFDRTLEPALPESREVRDHGYAAPTPATDGKDIFVFFGKSGVFKFNRDGKPAWQQSVGTKTHDWGCGTSPVLYKNLVIVNASVESGSLVALDKGTGREVWRAGGMDSSWNTPHLVDVARGKQELVVSVKNWILAFDPGTGTKLWQCRGIEDYVCPSIVSERGIVYAIGGRSSRAIAVRAGGKGDVTSSHVLWRANAGANVSSPVVHDGHLYWVSDRNQVAYCLRLADGEVVYEKRVDLQPYASALLADGKIYVVMRRGGTLVLAAKPEFERLALNKFESDRSTFNASPIVAHDRIYVRSDRHLYCIGKKS
jgi:outer membrane protein assembly factor BamB